MKTICVFGAASNDIDKEILKEAYNLGKMIADNSWNIIYGAGITGCMGAVSQGALDNNGIVIGVVPKFFNDIHLEDRNHNCTNTIITSNMADRKNVMEENCDAYVVCYGGFGTADELFEVITLKQLKQHNKPIIVFNVNHSYDSLEGYVNSLIQGKAAPDKGFVKFLTSVEDIEVELKEAFQK